MIQTEVCIIGAGPGGVATALKLSYLDIPCVLIDKATFPRDKTCGDAVSGKVTTLLNRLDPSILERFNAKPIQSDVWGIRFVAPSEKILDIPFSPNYVRKKKEAPGYVTKRIDFDHFLIKEIEIRENIQFFSGIAVEQYERTESGYRLSNKKGDFQVDTKLLIVANGAHSSFSRHHAGLEKDSRHHAGAVRAYYKNVKNLAKDNFIELHFIKSITPGYFWVFPLPNGQANVGIGMRSDIIKRKNINLRKAMLDIIDNHPQIKERFKDSELQGPIKGYGLPLGSKKRVISGDHFMLVGDAGHLIDPMTGEGIGNAFYSGFIAAEQAQECLAKNNFSANFLQAYDVRIARVLGSEMRLSYQMQRIMQYPVLVNIVASIIANNQRVLHVLSAMYNDFNLREQLVKPWFWVKMVLRRKSRELSSESSVESREWSVESGESRVESQES